MALLGRVSQAAAGAQYTGSDASPLRSGADHGRVLIKNVLRHTDRYASLKPYYLKLQVVGRDTPGIVEGAVLLFAPHYILHAIYSASPAVFANALAGPPGAASAFWRECHGPSWFTRHPAFAGELLHDTNFIPLLFHVDGCNLMNDADVHIWSFRSALVSEDMRPWLHK